MIKKNNYIRINNYYPYNWEVGLEVRNEIAVTNKKIEDLVGNYSSGGSYCFEIIRKINSERLKLRKLLEKQQNLLNRNPWGMYNA